MKLSQFQRDVLRYIGNRSASLAVRVLLKTLRFDIRNDEAIKKLCAEKKNFVSAFWHGSMIIGWYIHRNENVAALVSQSKDGEVLASTLKKWKFHVVRGSSSIGGHDALFMMIDLIREKFSLTITPDGPRGPIYKMKAGAVVSAQRTNVPLFLVGIGIKRKARLESWDRFEIPAPFTKVAVVYSNPIWIDVNLTRDETTKKIEECEALLNKLQKEALDLC